MSPARRAAARLVSRPGRRRNEAPPLSSVCFLRFCDGRLRDFRIMCVTRDQSVGRDPAWARRAHTERARRESQVDSDRATVELWDRPPTGRARVSSPTHPFPPLKRCPLRDPCGLSAGCCALPPPPAPLTVVVPTVVPAVVPTVVPAVVLSFALPVRSRRRRVRDVPDQGR